MDRATNSVRSRGLVSMGSEDRSSSQESPGEASPKRRAPGESFCDPISDSSPVSPSLNHCSPAYSVRRRLWLTQNVQQLSPTPPPFLSQDEDAADTVLPAVPSACRVMSGSEIFCKQTGGSSPVSPSLIRCHPSSPLPRGLLWIAQNAQQRSTTPPLCLNTHEETQSRAIPAVSSAFQVTSPTCTPQHFLLESPSALGRDFQAQHTPFSGVPGCRSHLTSVVQPSLSRPVSLTRNEELYSPDFISVPDHSKDAIQSAMDSRSQQDYDSDEEYYVDYPHEPTEYQESTGRASRKRRAPSRSFCDPTVGSSTASPALNHSSPARNVRRRLPSLPPSPVMCHENQGTQPSSQPSSALPPGLLEITRNVQQHTPTSAPCLNRDEDAPTTVLPVVSDGRQVVSRGERFCMPSGDSSPVSPSLIRSSSTHSVRCHPLSPLHRGLLRITQNARRRSLTPPPCLNRDKETPSTMVSAVSSACQVMLLTSTAQQSLLESPSAVQRVSHAQQNPCSGIQPSTSGSVSLTCNEELSSPDFISVPEHSMDLTGTTLNSLSLQPDYDSDEDENYYILEEEYIVDYSDEDDFELQEDEFHLAIEEMSYEELLALVESLGNANAGISSSEMHEFVKQIICDGRQNEEEICIICLEAYHDGDTVGQLSCGHEYHCSCIARWIRENPSCPICKRSPRRHTGAS